MINNPCLRISHVHNGWIEFPSLLMTIQKKEIHFDEKVPNRVEMQDAQKHLPCLKPLHIITDLKKPMMTEISQFDRVNLTVEVNFPRNSMIIT